ncbi:hypothetical protein ACJE3J_005679 [Pseudomonas aeruginosa]
MSHMDGDLHAQSEATIRALNLGDSSSSRLRYFLSFCHSKGLIRAINIKSSDKRDRTGHAQLDSSLDKLPNIESLLALSSIFSKIFESVSDEGVPKRIENIKMHDALVVTFALLSLASPNRMAAEIPLLTKQRLNSYSEVGGESVYYLNWVGSKGYPDNKTHLLAVLARHANKAINFFYNACEPARILCRFYEKPSRSLRDLLGDFKISPELECNLPLDLAPNLFTLGYALGFYNRHDRVPVLKEGVDLAAIKSYNRWRFFEDKPICSLLADDRLSVSQVRSAKLSALPYLFDYVYMPKVFHDKVTVTVREVQEWWISYYKKTFLPEFPLSYSSGDSCISLKDAMFCFLGSWLYGASNGVQSGSKSFYTTKYAVVPLASLGSSVARRLIGRSYDYLSIFEDYGFSAELRLTPHSLRHFSNTLADQSGIPVEIITAWSGRKSSEQTHTYIHTSHEDKVSRVSAIMNPSETDISSIRVVSQEELIKATNLPASITSTGLCTQNLNVSPCNYLNDFVSQCFMCSEACHVAGDEKAVALFEKDLSFQMARLNAVECDTRLAISRAMQQWYVIHSQNVCILSSLIELMRDCPVGTVIRYSNSGSEFFLTDTSTMEVKRVASAIPDYEAHLKGIIEEKNPSVTPEVNPQLRSLLSSFGLSEGEV